MGDSLDSREERGSEVCSLLFFSIVRTTDCATAINFSVFDFPIFLMGDLRLRTALILLIKVQNSLPISSPQ